MTNIGQLNTQKPIEYAMREIRDWLNKLGVSGLSINTNYDAKTNIAILKFRYKEKEYEFRSTKQRNARLNMHGISRVMEYKVRSHLMGIEDFGKSMSAYLQLEDRSGSERIITNSGYVDEKPYAILGINPLSSNSELKAHYLKMCKSYHPDMANSKEAKEVFEKKMAELNEAWTKIKSERGI